MSTQSASLSQLNGTSYNTSRLSLPGLTSSNPADSCATLVNTGIASSPGVYWLRTSGVVVEQACVNGISLGGNGSSPITASASCLAFYTWFGASGYAYISPSVTSSTATWQYCDAGTSRGGSGASLAMLSRSCVDAVAFFGAGDMAYVYVDANLDPTSAARVYCLYGQSVGGDGATPNRVAQSCTSAYMYFNVTSRPTYVDASLNASNALRVYCRNGTSYGADGSSVAESARSCDNLFSAWMMPSGLYYVNGVLVYVKLWSLSIYLLGLCCRPCFTRSVTSCQDARTLIPQLPSGVYTITVMNASFSAWCEMQGGSGWTLLMAVDSTLPTFGYLSATWTDTSSINPTTGYLNGVNASLGFSEYKALFYNSLPFSKVRLGLQYSGGPTNWIDFSVPSVTSMSAALQTMNIYTTTSLSQWQSVMPGLYFRPAASSFLCGLGIQANGYNHAQIGCALSTCPCNQQDVGRCLAQFGVGLYNTGCNCMPSS